MQFLQSPYLQNLRLDIVGLVTLLGDAAAIKIAHLAIVTPAGFLPRPLPAPQVLLQSERLRDMKTKSGTVIQVYTGISVDYVNELADTLHGGPLRPFEVRQVELAMRDRSTSGLRGIRAAPFSPIPCLAMFSFSMFIALLVVAIHFGDGMGLLGTLLLNLLATLIQLGTFSSVLFAPFNLESGPVLASDVVVKYPNGAFVIVKCQEQIASKIYLSHPQYTYLVNDSMHKLLGLLGIIMLIGGVVALGNAHIETQIAYIIAYVVLNISYWLVSSLRIDLNWDLSMFETHFVHVEHETKTGNYPQALWSAIVCSRSTEWVIAGNLIPQTSPWIAWLEEAKQILTDSMALGPGSDLPKWDAQQALLQHLQDFIQRNAAENAHIRARPVNDFQSLSRPTQSQTDPSQSIEMGNLSTSFSVSGWVR